MQINQASKRNAYSAHARCMPANLRYQVLNGLRVGVVVENRGDKERNGMDTVKIYSILNLFILSE
jgi:hypothetical protein